MKPNLILGVFSIIFSIAVNAQVGINTTSPEEKLHLSGSSAKMRIDGLAAVNNAAEEFLQVATQAPHPMQAAASIAASATDLGIGIAFASGAVPVLALIKAPFSIIRSKA